MKKIAVLGLIAALCLAGCQAAPVTQGLGNKQDAGAPQSAPVDQGRSMVYAPTYVFGSGNISNPKNGVDASGDIKAAESQRTGMLTGGAQTSTPTQTNDLSGVAQAATELLKTLDPASGAGKLASSAVDLAKAGKLTEAKAALKAAQDAAKADAKPTETPAPAPIPDAVK